MSPLVTVIAVGNPYRRDDGAGAAVLSRLRERFGDDPRVRLADLDGEPVRLVQTWEGSDIVWLVDAVRSGRPPGSVHEVDAARLAELDDRGVRVGGGHLLGLGEAVELARVLDRMPAVLRVLGIDGESFEHGEGLTDAANRGVVAAAVRITTELERVLSGR